MSNSLAETGCQNINHLPDAILHHVLSFLPTKEAVATSVISKQWRYLWTWVSVLDFQDSPCCEFDGNKRKAFSELVSKASILNRVVSIDKIRLNCAIYHGGSRINTWIHGAVRRGDVREIEISIDRARNFRYNHSRFLELRSCFFSIMNVKVLKLSDGILIHVPNGISVCFPSLKILHLVCIEYANNESVAKLFRGCTVLEELVVDRFSEDNVRNFIISIPTLKTLSYISHQEKEKWLQLVRDRYQLTINAPVLEYLKIKNVWSLVHFESVFISLIKADIDFHGIGLFQLAKALCNAKFLSLEWITCGDIRALLKDDSFPLFLNLIQLELKIDVEDRDVIPLFLENCPKLEVVVLSKIIGSESNNLIGTSKQGHVPKYVSPHLRKVFDEGFQGRERELEMVEYVLKKARALELIEICCNDIPLESKFGILQKLSKFPRGSKTCQLIFNPEIHLKKSSYAVTQPLVSQHFKTENQRHQAALGEPLHQDLQHIQFLSFSYNLHKRRDMEKYKIFDKQPGYWRKTNQGYQIRGALEFAEWVPQRYVELESVFCTRGRLYRMLYRVMAHKQTFPWMIL